ncbi:MULTISPECIES: alpha-glucosidase [Rhizobium]|uniref:beta-galactosidase BglA n=1 Tax=Rhizobium TaxID=379 RepID=UPI001C924072|nr:MULTISPECIES: alpha-glucosidase [Rhizobium]MBY3052807.1 alpha-glucosidase [Rhizobium laguerreae]MBY3442783.1 alpha-glucosidase [Rhizobium laguerreae]MBY5543228.1 alpha-glucosidase [Rhizobium leguminosarum]MBY5584591.1 alpha-glucosidase [Rhizobium leguminosarum]MBY5651588.1 alpha-glucosidase [Rhizobium leguminosarum]
MNVASQSISTPDKDWWRGAVIYQIYPRSYQDSNGDGIGDLKGITARLPHVASLGVDAIWISPFFTSPMRDFGYDVSDYENVDSIFGTLVDFDTMIAEAHRLGIRVMIDLVISHSSDQHPWFVQSRSSKTNAKADWYVWADAKPDGTPPNNWLSIFGGSAWAWDPTRMQYYLHNFLTSQPDMNLHNPEVQDRLLDVVRFWLNRGVDGFRLDTINFYFHDTQLRDNPALAPERRNASTAPAVNPYNFQEHLYDKNRPENLAFLKRFRAVLEEFPAIAAVGEVGDSQRGLEIVGEYTSGNDKMHMCYAFEFLAPDPLTPERVEEVMQDFEAAAPDGWACWAFSNHDVMRHVSRWGGLVADHDAFAKLYASLLLTLRGSVCLYQGEELALTEADLAYQDLQDPYGIQFWPEFKGRDGCRTPMVWDSQVAQGGFSTVKPWLPVPVEHILRAVSVQLGDETSVLEHYRRFIAFRKLHPAFAKGEIEFEETQGDSLVFTREYGNEKLLCIFNMSPTEAGVILPAGEWQALTGHGFTSNNYGDKIDIPAWGAYFARLA